MLRHWLQKTIQTFNGALQINLKRFPITLFFILSLTCYLCYLVAADQPENKKLYWILGYYLSVGTLLSLSLHLWCEEIKSLIKKSIIQIGAHALLIADAFYLYSYSYEKSFTEIGIAHGAGLLAIGLSIFFLSFLKEKNDIPSWNFAVSSITSCITANLIGCVMSCGISLLVLSLHKLFNIDIDTRYYLYIVIICNVCLPLLLFLGLLPSRQEKHNTFPLLHSFLNNVIHYLFLPLTGGYLIVLYIYALRILASWELPIGWVSWLVIALMTGCIAIEFGLYPTRMAHGKRIDELIARWLPAFVLPLLCLMTIGIIRRFNDYGVTINRLYLITLNVWCYFVCITLILIKAKRINWIPVSFSIIFLLTSILPVNYSSITQKTIQNEINKEIQNTQQKKLPFSHEEYTQWLKNFSSAKAQSINEKIIYLYEWFGKESIASWIDENVSLYMLRTEFKNEGETQGTTSYSGKSASEAFINIPDGYDKLQYVNQYYVSTNDECEKQILAIPLQQENDTVYISYQTLEKLNQYKYGEMPPTELKYNSNRKIFYLTEFSVENTTENNKKHTQVSINGYLFSK